MPRRLAPFRALLLLCFVACTAATGQHGLGDPVGGDPDDRENCSNALDDDGDGDTDCEDLECSALVTCGGGLFENCGNAVDDDQDGTTDCDDADCLSAIRCSAPSETACANGADDDGDGAKDCEDSDCSGTSACAGEDPAEDCTGNRDEDADGAVDCDDSDCLDNPACGADREDCANAVDDDGDGAVDCDDADCAEDLWCVDDGGDDWGGEGEGEVDPAVCGDGAIAGVEQCDDGNGVDGDGCSAACSWELTDVAEVEGDAAQDVAANSLVAAHFDPAGDDDWYRIELGERDRLIVETSDGAGGCGPDTVVQLFGDTRPDPLPASTSCTEEGDLACDDDSGSGMCSRLEWVARAAGAVHVRVLEYGDDAAGDYSIAFVVRSLPALDATPEVEPNDAPGDGAVVEPGTSIEGAIDPETDDDFFLIEVADGATLRFETSDGFGGCSMDTVVSVYDAEAAPAASTCSADELDLACDDDGGNGSCSLLTHTFAAAGIYAIRVQSYSERSTGSYVLSITTP